MLTLRPTSRYKPVAIINVLKPLAHDYSELFLSSFDKDKNSKFFEHLNVIDFVKRTIQQTTAFRLA